MPDAGQRALSGKRQARRLGGHFRPPFAAWLDTVGLPVAQSGGMIRRACAAVLSGDSIVMVRHIHDGRDYWTLPGGGVERGEEPAVAAVRELREETGLVGTAVGELFARTYRSLGGDEVEERCFLVSVASGSTPVRGTDPELSDDSQLIATAAWRPLARLADDRQVGLVLRRLGR